MNGSEEGGSLLGRRAGAGQSPGTGRPLFPVLPANPVPFPRPLS